MLTMQENDSRLIKAARRTIRAEITLVVVIIIIASWSVYALYKLSTSNGSEQTIFGLTFSKQMNKPQESTSIKSAVSSPTNDLKTSVPEQPTQVKRDLLTHEQLTYLQKQNEERIRDKLVKEILEGQKELNISLWPLNHYNRSVVVEKLSNPPSLIQLNKVKSAPIKADSGASNYGGYSSASSNRAAAADPATASPVADHNKEHEHQDNVRSEESNYRQAAETGTDPTESLSDVSDNDSDYSQPTSNAGDEDPNSAVETTESPLKDDAKASDNEDDPTQSGSAETPNSSDESNTEDQPATTTEEPPDSLPDDETMKEAGLDIDDEVDRMTQPSLGVASQQETPINYNNTVQFDDAPASSVGVSSASSASQEAVKKPGGLIARFVAPHGIDPSNREQANRVRDYDLQVDQNSPTTLSGLKEAQSKNGKSKPRLDSSSEKGFASRSNKTRLDSVDRRYKLLKTDGAVRHKRSLAVGGGKDTTIRDPHELDVFMNSLDFDALIGQSSSDVVQLIPRMQLSVPSQDNTSGLRRREARSLASNGGDINGTGLIDREEEEVDPKVNLAASNLDQMPDSSPRRSDLETPEYNYLATNDTGLQELLAQKQLLDALRKSKLPSPSVIGDSHSTGPPETAAKDHQAADSLYSVDHGLLLYPSANEEHDHGHKSEGKKKKKHEMVKHKKKTTIAMKKGGHKKKKHKKEEKKFLKEKKFKGAKKGKKVHKGKGGKGGKKGKKLYKDKGFKKKGFKNVYHKEEFGQKKSYFDEFRDKDFKKKWKKFDDKYNYAQMKKWQAKNVKGAKKMKDQGEKYKKYDKSKWRKKYHKDAKEHSASMMKKKKDSFGFAR